MCLYEYSMCVCTHACMYPHKDEFLGQRHPVCLYEYVCVCMYACIYIRKNELLGQRLPEYVCLYVYVYVIHVRIKFFIHTYIHTHVCNHTYVWLDVCTHIRINVWYGCFYYEYKHVHTPLYAHMHKMWVHACAHIWIFICIPVWRLLSSSSPHFSLSYPKILHVCMCMYAYVCMHVCTIMLLW
jgi:hypothetical protein